MLDTGSQVAVAIAGLMIATALGVRAVDRAVDIVRSRWGKPRRTRRDVHREREEWRRP